MKCNLFVAAVAVALMMASVVCSADTFPDAYVRAGIGISKLSTIHYDTSASGTPVSASVNSKDGYNPSIAFGAKFDNGWRAEGAFDYIRNKGKTFTSANLLSFGTSSFADRGATRATTYMVDALYDLDFQALSLTPYIGLGVGVASLIHDIQFTPGTSTLAEICLPAITFAGQGIIGVSYGWSDQLKINLDYRYLQTAKNKLPPPVLEVTPGITANRYTANRISIGLSTSI